MNKKQKIIIEIIIILIIIIIVIYNLINVKKSTEDFIYTDNINYTNYNDNLINTNTNLENEIEIEKIKVYIIGQVNSSGVIELEYGSRIEDAIILAGGPTEIADLSKVNLAYQIEDGQKIYIPSIYDKNVEYVLDGSGENIIEGNNNSQNTNKKININKSNVTELTSIPGIGESTAQKIIDYRNENGKFSSIEDLKNISGIGEKKFEKIKEYIDIK